MHTFKLIEIANQLRRILASIYICKQRCGFNLLIASASANASDLVLPDRGY